MYKQKVETGPRGERPRIRLIENPEYVSLKRGRPEKEKTGWMERKVVITHESHGSRCEQFSITLFKGQNTTLFLY